MSWFKLASHLGLPLQEAMEKTTSREFVEWIAYLEMERNEREKQDYYLALIATEMRRSYIKDPRSVQIEDLLLTFKTSSKRKEEETQVLTVEEEKEQRMSLSKAFWFGVVGVKNVRD